MGYWSKVFQRTTEILDKSPLVDSEVAYLLARRQIDFETDSLDLGLDGEYKL